MSTPTLIRHTGILAGRTFAHWRAAPGPFLINLFFPVLVLVMMGGLLGGALAGSVGSYFAYAVPGVLVIAMLFGIESTMVAVTTDTARTITDRFRSLPIHAGSILAGRCVADMAASALGLVVTIGAGLALGWRPAGVTSLLLAVALLLWFRFGLLWFGLWAGLKAKSPDAVVAAQILVWPVSMLSAVFVDPTTMPRWLGVIAEWNPLSMTTTAVRQITESPGFASTAFPSVHAQLLAVITPALMVALFAPLATTAYRNTTT